VCIERVLNEYDPPDKTFGDLPTDDNFNVSFKFAFNTLIINNIIIALETDE